MKKGVLGYENPLFRGSKRGFFKVPRGEGVNLTIMRLGYARNSAGLRGNWGAVMGAGRGMN